MDRSRGLIERIDRLLDGRGQARIFARSLDDVTSDVWTRLFRSTFGYAPRVLDAEATTRDESDDVEAVLKELSETVLKTNLDHVDGAGLVARDVESVERLVEIFEAFAGRRRASSSGRSSDSGPSSDSVLAVSLASDPSSDSFSSPPDDAMWDDVLRHYRKGTEAVEKLRQRNGNEKPVTLDDVVESTRRTLRESLPDESTAEKRVHFSTDGSESARKEASGSLRSDRVATTVGRPTWVRKVAANRLTGADVARRPFRVRTAEATVSVPIRKTKVLRLQEESKEKRGFPLPANHDYAPHLNWKERFGL